MGLLQTRRARNNQSINKKASGVDINRVIESSDEEEILSDPYFSDAAGKVVSSMFKDHQQKLKSIEEFKTTIIAFIDAVKSCSGKQNPTFIFVDELDRCRPSYAVEMLEVIKHFFDMPNVIFVVATDTEQLQHAVKAVYGNDFDANVYLGRFFKRRCTLKEQPRLEFIANHLLYLSEEQTDEFFPKIWPQLDNDKGYFFELLASISDIYTLSLRETEQLVDKILAILVNLNEEKIDLLLLCSLMVIHDKNHQYYRCIMTNKKPINSTHKYYDLGTIVQQLGEDNLDTKINVKLSTNTLVATETPSGIPFSVNTPESRYELIYKKLFSDQIRALHDPESYTRLSNEVRQDQNANQGIPKNLQNVSALEFTNLSQVHSKYQDWIETAASFD